MLRWSSIAALTLGLPCLLGTLSTAHAQGAAAAPTMPTIIELHKIPVGSWSEYSMDVKGQPPMSQRLAVVGRDEATTTVEVTLTGGPVARAGSVLVQATMESDPKGDYPLKRLVMKLGTQPAMEMPLQMQAGQKPLEKIDPSRLTGKLETIKVPAGTFKARRYVDKRGDLTITAWVSENVPPFGLVKMQGETAVGPVLVQLVKRGTDAQSQIGKNVQPFDPQALMKLFGAMSAGAGAEAPAPAPTPAKPAAPKEKGAREKKR